MSNLRPVANGNGSDRITNRIFEITDFFDGTFIPEDKTIRWTCNKGKYVRFGARTSEYFERKTQFCVMTTTRGEFTAAKIILPFQRFQGLKFHQMNQNPFLYPFRCLQCYFLPKKL